MATLESLGYKSISEMSQDEAIELICQIRLSRRVQKKSRKSTSKKRQAKAIPQVTKAQAQRLLKLLGGNK